MDRNFSLTANLVDIDGKQFQPATLRIENGRIRAIEPSPNQTSGSFILPGFIDAHVHIESSMLVPTEFAREAVLHGTVATVSDPHEIANVLGVEGVQYMLKNAEQSPLKIFFGAPSCVPATPFETAGAEINVAEVEALLDDPRIGYLSEMMNYPGVLQDDPTCLAKLRAAHQRGKPIDGHAPGLRGDEARRYIEAGISTDHECVSKEEALEKLAAGCKIAIREGSAARNFDALYTLLGEYPDNTMLCSDDLHPDKLLAGHINLLVAKAVRRGIDVYDALRAACITPIEHYQLEVGQLRVGDPADFIEVDSLTRFKVLRTWIDGELVAEQGQTTIPRTTPQVVNQFASREIPPESLGVPATGEQIQLIEAIDGQLITGRKEIPATVTNGYVRSDTKRDLLKLVVINRYQTATAGVAFVRGFGLHRGAIASSVAHDSHNIVAVGAGDDDIATAVNRVMRERGGLSVASQRDHLNKVLPLPIAGLMATGTCREVGTAYSNLEAQVKQLGSQLRAPYMTLAFMALLVIPELKLSDLGLFDGVRFELIPLMA
jgi:adenine deaminase